MDHVHIMGVPLDLGSGRRGVDMGPSALRIAGLGERVAALGYHVLDKGNLETPVVETRAYGDPCKRYIEEIRTICSQLFETALDSHRAGALPLVLGGDHSVAAGSVAASAEWAAVRGQRMGLLWVDAHADMNTPATTPSGNVHGMPLAALLGPEPAELSSLGPRSPKVDAAHTVLLGLRDLDPKEKARVRDAGVRVFTMKDIDRKGLASVADQALQLAGQDTAGIHLSFDLDVCDPSIAPGVGTPVRGGLSYREAHALMEFLAESGQLRAVDVVEANPMLDTRNATAELGVELVLSALGKTIL